MLYLRFSLFCNGFFYIFIIFFEFEIVAQQLSVVSESEDFGKFHSWEKQLKTFTVKNTLNYSINLLRVRSSNSVCSKSFKEMVKKNERVE